MNRKQRVSQPKIDFDGAQGPAKYDSFLDNPVMAKNPHTGNARHNHNRSIDHGHNVYSVEGRRNGPASKSQDRFNGKRSMCWFV